MSSEVKELEQRRQEYRDYPVEVKSALIQYIQNSSGNVQAASKAFNIPYDTAYYWWKNSERYFEFQTTSSVHLAEKLHKIGHKAADSLLEHDLSIVSARDKAAIIQSSVQTRNLLLGLPTSVNETIQHTEVSILLQDALSTCLDVTPEPATEPTEIDASQALDIVDSHG